MRAIYIDQAIFSLIILLGRFNQGLYAWGSKMMDGHTGENTVEVASPVVD